jgi:hypothetical protein
MFRFLMIAIPLVLLVNLEAWPQPRKSADSQNVHFLIDTALENGARAAVINGLPVVLYNPAVLAAVNEKTMLFIMYQRYFCYAINHDTAKNKISLLEEERADCQAINYLVKNKLIAKDSVVEIVVDIIWSKESEWNRLFGVPRDINLYACLGISPKEFKAKEQALLNRRKGTLAPY